MYRINERGTKFNINKFKRSNDNLNKVKRHLTSSGIMKWTSTPTAKLL
jgi:hypothetical protein